MVLQLSDGILTKKNQASIIQPYKDKELILNNEAAVLCNKIAL